MTKTASNPKGKLPLAKIQTPPTKQTNNYIYKNKFSTVLQMELEFWDKNPFKATAKAFPSGFHMLVIFALFLIKIQNYATTNSRRQS